MRSKAALVVAISLGLISATAEVTAGVGPAEHSTCSNGAAAGTPLWDSAVLVPVPVTRMTKALPLDQAP